MAKPTRIANAGRVGPMNDNVLNIANIPVANEISICTCADPTCGPHLVFWFDGKMIAQAPMSCEIAFEIANELLEFVEWKSRRPN